MLALAEQQQDLDLVQIFQDLILPQLLLLAVVVVGLLLEQ
jgi:hypothetical protein